MRRLSIQKLEPRIENRVWGKEIFLVENKSYVGKRLEMNAGTAGGLQVHVEKEETFYLLSGQALVDYDDGYGNLVRHEMVPGEIFHIPTNATHRVTAVVDCVFFEWSLPIRNDRVRVETEYGQPVPTDKLELGTTWEEDLLGILRRKK
mgnify:FL=1